MPNAVGALHETKKFFTDAQANPANEEVQLDVHERSVDGMIELGLEHIQLQRDLHLDYMHAIHDVPRTQIEARLADTFTEINATRSDPIDIRSVDEQVLRKMSEPNWLELSPEALAAQPDYLQDTAELFRETDAKLAILSQDETLRNQAHDKYREKMETTKTAMGILKIDQRRDELGRQISEVYERAAKTGRSINRSDKQRIERLEVRLKNLDEGEILANIEPNKLPELTSELNRLVRKDTHRQLEEGLLLTPSMQETIDKTLPSLAVGRPALFVGETGGAKTALAEAIANQFMGKEPELVSFHGEINVYQLIGKDRLSDGATDFSPGPVVRAMEQGRPLILDEINSAPPEFLKRLNIIMQLRPGDIFTIQEDSGKQVVVQPGFCIMATANEKSARYKGVDVMSAEFKNRFGVNVHRIEYPDSDVVFGQAPLDNMALAEAALSDDIGEFAVDLPEGQLQAFVKAAHASQRIFSGNYGDGNSARELRAYVSGDRLADGKPGLDDTVLSPRMMVAVLEQVRDGRGAVQLVDVLKDWVKGIEKPNDRAVMTQLLDSHVSTDNTTLLGNSYGEQNR